MVQENLISFVFISYRIQMKPQVKISYFKNDSINFISLYYVWCLRVYGIFCLHLQFANFCALCKINKILHML